MRKGGKSERCEHARCIRRTAVRYTQLTNATGNYTEDYVEIAQERAINGLDARAREAFLGMDTH